MPFYGVGARRIRTAVKRGDLRASTFGGKWFRIRPSDFEAWADATRVVPARDEIAERVDTQLRRENAL